MHALRFLVLGTMLAACSGGTGRLQVFLEAEDTIPDGIEGGPGDEQIADGWSVQYTKFLIGFGDFRARRVGDTSPTAPAELRDERRQVFDLLALPSGGLVVADFPDVAAARWSRVGYSLVGAGGDGVTRGEGTAEADFALMQQGDYSLYFEATLTKADGQSCRPSAPTDCVARAAQTIRWGVSAPTGFDGCAPPDGQAGFAIPSGGTTQIKPTIHGDHWFFTNLTQGAEITERRAQWIVDSDLDRDGETTLDELRQVPAADVFPSEVYNLTGGIDAVNYAYDYLIVQARTLGDYQGEGECPTRTKL